MIRDDVGQWVYGKGWELVCLQCGEKFYAKRTDAQYCGAACRQAARRRKDKIKRVANHVVSDIGFIRGYMQKFPDLELAGALELERIATALNVTHRHEADTRVAVTLAVVTDKVCRGCGKLTTVSPASGLCLECIKQKTG